MSTVSDGNLAEEAVGHKLKTLGYKIIEQNWKTAYAEIDIVATKADTIIFIEVKYRRTDYAGDGFDYITSNKLNHIMRAARGWVQEHDWRGPYELMAASVLGNEPDYKIELRQIL
ncbi:YraN family protein [Candidatus Saccharibacteria bacterium]|nr:YraN family protein [Candidatus Saccharibacteria bacterium]